MGNIEYFSDRDLSSDSNLERIVAAAKADAGLWLMVREREMEMRAQRASQMRSGRSEQAFQSKLKPSLSALAGALVRRIFGNCPPEVIGFVEARLLEAVKTEIYSITSGDRHAEAGNPKDD